MKRTLVLLLCAFIAFQQSFSKEKVYVGHLDQEQHLVTLAAQEMCKYLPAIYPGVSFRTGYQPKSSRQVIVGTYAQLSQHFNSSSFPAPAENGYVIRQGKSGDSNSCYIVGDNPRATLDAVYALLEKLGYGFYLTHDTAPVEKKSLDFSEWELSDHPMVDDRIVFNWHNFLSGCTSWNFPDWQSWVYQSSKMGFNTIMIHAYANNPNYQFEMNGEVKPVGYMNTSVSGRDWGAQHVNDVRRLPGGSLFDGPVFGADCAMVPDEERVAAATSLTQQVFNCAKANGLKVIFAIDTDTKAANPQNIVLTLPEKARFRGGDAWLANPEVPEGYAYFKKVVKDILQAYPQIDKLALWIRGGGTSWTSLKPEHLPAVWQKEYADFIQKNPELTKYSMMCGHFALAKAVRAYQRALRDNGRADIEVMVGSWNWLPVNVANHVMPEDVTFIPLDHRYVLDQPSTFEQLSKIGAKRKLVPVVWAQHDDHRFAGRSYKPFENFNDVLKANKAKGFGIIHWTNMPHDIFFKNISRQVWSTTENKTLKATISDFVTDHWQSHSVALNDYFYKWSCEAPQFGMETYDVFLGPYAYGCVRKQSVSADVTIQKCRERISLLESVPAAVARRNKNLLRYMKGMEQHYIKIYENQRCLDSTYQALGKNNWTEAQQHIAMADAQEAVELYAKALRYGKVTQSDLGLLYSLGTRYYPFYEHLRQLCGMAPLYIKFGKTLHDPLAQGAYGAYTWFIDKKGQLQQVRGRRELERVVTETENGVSFSQPLMMKLQPMYYNGLLEKAYPLSEGMYEISITFEGMGEPNLEVSYVADNLSEKPLDFDFLSKGKKATLRMQVAVSGQHPQLKLIPKCKVTMTLMTLTKIE